MVTFETKVYERDWQIILRDDFLASMVARCDYPFSRRVLFVNNVNDVAAVSRQARALVSSQVIDAFYVVDEYASAALSFFDLTRDQLGAGYYYSIQELVGIYVCETPYLLHFSGDAGMANGATGQWISSALDLFAADPSVVVANPVWNGAVDEVRRESIWENHDFCKGFGFSDQCYLIPTSTFRRPIYGYTHPESARYPAHAGELFEKRVDAYMRSHQKYRATATGVSYVHPTIVFPQ